MMHIPDETYRWINALEGMAYDYAVEYLHVWMHGGRTVDRAFYVRESQDTAYPCSFIGLANIAARIRAEVHG